MRRKPGYRCSMATLRGLSHTSAYFDLSGGVCKPMDFTSLAVAVSRYIGSDFGGNRSLAERQCVKHLVTRLGIRDYSGWAGHEKQAMRQLAPMFCLLPGLSEWRDRDRGLVAAALKASGAAGGFGYLSHMSEVPRLARAFHEVAASEAHARSDGDEE
jgi:hypothetical protein